MTLTWTVVLVTSGKGFRSVVWETVTTRLGDTWNYTFRDPSSPVSSLVSGRLLYTPKTPRMYVTSFTSPPSDLSSSWNVCFARSPSSDVLYRRKDVRSPTLDPSFWRWWVFDVKVNCGTEITGGRSVKVNWVLTPGVRGHTGYKVSCPTSESTKSVYSLLRGPTGTDLRDRVLCVIPRRRDTQ